MNTKWPSVRLGEVLKLCDTSVPASQLAEVNLAGVYSFARGLFKRGPMSPAKTSYKAYNRLVADDFVISQPKAWEGALARVTPEFEGWYLSPVFPTFRANRERLEPAFLEWFCKRRPVWEELQHNSRGIGARRETVSPEQFLLLQLPLPPVAEQRRIVARIEELSARIEGARKLRKETAGDADGLLLSELHRRFVTEENAWPRSTVGECAEIIDPNPSHRMPHYAETGYPFISTVDFVGSEEIRRRTAKYVAEETYLEQKSRCSFAVGDILYTRIGTIGQARLLTEVWPFALSHVLVVLKPKAEMEPRFLLWYLRSDSIISQADEATRSIGVPDLGIKRIREFHMPRPSSAEQRQIVAYLDYFQKKSDVLTKLQEESSRKLDALMPSILDWAFRGEL